MCENVRFAKVGLGQLSNGYTATVLQFNTLHNIIGTRPILYPEIPCKQW